MTHRSFIYRGFIYRGPAAAALLLLLLAGSAFASDASRRIAADVERLVSSGSFTEARDFLAGLDCGGDTACATFAAFSRGYLYERWAAVGADDDPEIVRARLDRAASSYREALALEPRNEHIRANLAHILARQGHLDAVEQLLLTRGSEDVDRLLYVGDLHAEKGDHEKALAYYARAEKLAPESEEIHRRVFRLHRREPRPKELFEYCRKLWKRKLDLLAVEGLELVVRTAWEDDPELADQALVHWADLGARSQSLRPADLNRLPPAWTSDAVEELRELLAAENPPERLGGWWGDDALRQHVAARVLQARAASYRARGELDRAMTFLKAASRLAPSMWRYDQPPLEGRPIVYLEALIDLAAVYHQADEDEKVRSIVLELFEGKEQAYRNADLPAINRFHTVLGLIFAEQGRWTSDWRADNAVFQLENAIKTAEELAARESRAAEPMPRLRAYLAQGYRETDRRAEGAEAYARAALDYLALGDTRRARENLGLAQSLDASPLRLLDPETAEPLRRLETGNSRKPKNGG